jgi:hypothetical protein
MLRLLSYSPVGYNESTEAAAIAGTVVVGEERVMQ